VAKVGQQCGHWGIQMLDRCSGHRQCPHQQWQTWICGVDIRDVKNWIGCVDIGTGASWANIGSGTSWIGGVAISDVKVGLAVWTLAMSQVKSVVWTSAM
jgi:hypothetical protein